MRKRSGPEGVSSEFLWSSGPYLETVAYPGILLVGGGVSTNSVEDRENGDLGAVAL